jgi:hypothetical protein
MTEARRITYRFATEEGSTGTFVVDFDGASLVPRSVPDASLPEWTRLDCHPCPDCPLARSAATRCPMAVALADLQQFAGGLDSFHSLAVTVDMPERTSHAVVSAQRALGSLMGLLIASCACPDVAWLRPMARFHLPLANEEETSYRAVSMYLLAQYFRHKQGAEPDFSLAGLQARYRRLHEINMAMAARLRSTMDKDAPINAVILLDMFAKAMPYWAEGTIAELEPLFRAYLD